MSLRSICTKLSTSDKKLRQRLSTNALRFGFATTRTSQQTVDAYDVRFALGLLKDATDNKLQAFATAQIIMTLLAGLVIQTDVTGEYQEIVMSVLLIIINGSVVVLGLVSTALMLPVKCCYGRSRVFQNRLLDSGALKKLSIFEHLPEPNVKKIARYMRLKCYSGIGTEIFAQGAKADSMLVIARGTVSIKIDGVEKRKMKAPEVLGEKVLVGNQQHRRALTGRGRRLVYGTRRWQL